MRAIERRFYKSAAWEACRNAYLCSVGHFCERCKAKGIYEPARIVHHKIYLTEDNYHDPSISLNFENLEALCLDCHNKEHYGSKIEARYTIGKDGELIF